MTYATCINQWNQKFVSIILIYITHRYNRTPGPLWLTLSTITWIRILPSLTDNNLCYLQPWNYDLCHPFISNLKHAYLYLLLVLSNFVRVNGQNSKICPFRISCHLFRLSYISWQNHKHFEEDPAPWSYTMWMFV
jgi:hypothetical protein